MKILSPKRYLSSSNVIGPWGTHSEAATIESATTAPIVASAIIFPFTANIFSSSVFIASGMGRILMSGSVAFRPFPVT